METHTDNVTIRDASDVGLCRRRATHMASLLGFNEVAAGEIAIIASELAANVVKHAYGKGEMILSRNEEGRTRAGIRITCIDDGPGIGGDEAFADGFSTKGTLGIGLGSVARLADTWHIRTPDSGRGTEVTVTKQRTGESAQKQENVKRRPHPLEIGARSRPYPGLTANGDAYAIRFLTEERVLVAVIDGLGHGFAAQEAADVAVKHTDENINLDLNVLLDGLHVALRPTRGAVVAMARIDLGTRTLQFAGVGNIGACLLSDDRHLPLISKAGIVGHRMPSVPAFEAEWTTGSSLLMWSDGLRDSWMHGLDTRILNAHPSILADTVIRNYARANDDATIVGIHQARA